MFSTLEEYFKKFNSYFKTELNSNSFNYSLDQLENSGAETWKNWEKQSGIYIFSKDDKVLYIGRALKNNLGDRVYSQINAKGDVKWDNVINDKDTRIDIICLNDTDWFWVASLEAFLINSLRPLINKRSS